MTTINNLTIEQMREIVSKAPSNAESYQGGYYFRESPQFMFHNGFHDQWNLTDNDGLYFKAAGFHPVRIDDLRTAIAEHDREFKVGDLVVHPKFDNKKIYEIIEIKGDLFTVFYDRNSHSFRSDLRHATPSEIKAGHRIDDNTDHVTDIRNHVSPSTRVVDL
ncbi:hypothetical protein [Acinetobacter guillouiae]|uniref:hypothetical protein n=1 Tax=Acinetobacter guillouiae TaxID=106649 RepID=UPI003C701077